MCSLRPIGLVFRLRWGLEITPLNTLVKMSELDLYTEQTITVWSGKKQQTSCRIEAQKDTNYKMHPQY